MRTLRVSLAGMVILVLFAGGAVVAVAQTEADATGVVAASEGPPSDEPESLLFVGNSLTYYHGGVEKQVAALAAAEDPPREIVVEAETSPAATLKVHHQLSEPESLYGALDAIREAGHDVVVLQEYIPFNYPKTLDTFFEYARLFDAEVTGAGAETVFFMTWPAGGRLDWIDLDGMVKAHRQVEADLGAKIAPVGLAMDGALAERPDLAMLARDQRHPSPAGSYLAAATIYATLFDRSPEGLAVAPEDVTPEDAAFLQRIAWETVRAWQVGSPPAE